MLLGIQPIKVVLVTGGSSKTVNLVGAIDEGCDILGEVLNQLDKLYIDLIYKLIIVF